VHTYDEGAVEVIQQRCAVPYLQATKGILQVLF